MDEITSRVMKMYEQYPYPSPAADTRTGCFMELANLLKLFAVECTYDLSGKSVLDAGTGTGHRVIEAARGLPRTNFFAVDLCEPALAVARDMAHRLGVKNVRFENRDLLGEVGSARHDVILCMGVLHHLSHPRTGLKNLVAQLSSEGLLWLYVYGRHGSRERMRRKQLLKELLNGADEDLSQGVALARSLNFEPSGYGWTAGEADATTRDALIVDSYLNRNENLYDIPDIDQLMAGCGLRGYAIYGFSVGSAGLLVDTRLDSRSRFGVPKTDPAAQLKSRLAIDAYNALSTKGKLRALDLMYEPNGYTILGFTRCAREKIDMDGRVASGYVSLETEL